MKALTTLLFLVASSMFCGQKGDTSTQIMLPSPGLIRCDAAQLWQYEKAGAGAVYPAQVAMDHFDKSGCPQGMIALYDKTVSVEDIKAGLDRHYGKWAINSTHRGKLWRVESEKVAIQLATIDDSLKETGTMGEKGMKQVIYLSFIRSK